MYGQEKVLATSGIARMNMFLHGVEDFHIVRGDTMREPAFFTGSRLAQFDMVIANPPFSLKNWGHEAWASDRWGRNRLGGVPPKGYADWGWVQHMLTSAKPGTGRIAVVLPQGALFRGGAEARIREQILREDKIEAVIGLAPNLFYGTGLAACVLVLRTQKPEETAGKVLVVNGETLFKRGRNQNTLEPEHAATLLAAYRDFADKTWPRPRRNPRRDRAAGLQPKHPALRRAGRRRRTGHPRPGDRRPGGCAGGRPGDPRRAGGRTGQVGPGHDGSKRMSKRITQRELESYLWGAAVLLRGLIDAGDYKQFIFPLVFLKRLSDVYDEERAAALEMYDGDEELADLPENHRFAIPDGAHWDDIRKVTTNVGPAILRAMRAIESANPDTLPGVFGDGDWGNKNLLPDSTLLELVEHFSSKTLSVANLPEDELGQGYEFLIKKFADDSGHTAQEFYTNRTLVHLMTMMLRPEPGESVYDPTCGTGGMLISTAAELRRQGKEWRNLRLYGQELNYGTSAIARMNLFLHGIRDGHIAHGDVLANPHFKNSRGGLRTFDVVLANPPYSIKSWNRAAFTSDPYGRNIWGVPPQNAADYAFFQHIAKSLDPKTGRAAILLPHGVLTRYAEAARA